MSRVFKYEPEPNERAIYRRVNGEIFTKISQGMTVDEANRATAAENGFDVVDDTTNKPTSSGAKHISDLADIITEASKNKISRADALAWLINNRHGRTFTQAYKSHKQQKEAPPMTDNLQSLVKDYGIVSVAKGIVDRGHTSTISEHELTAMI